jgi:hypothetical protein
MNLVYLTTADLIFNSQVTIIRLVYVEASSISFAAGNGELASAS